MVAALWVVGIVIGVLVIGVTIMVSVAAHGDGKLAGKKTREWSYVDGVYYRNKYIFPFNHVYHAGYMSKDKPKKLTREEKNETKFLKSGKVEDITDSTKLNSPRGKTAARKNLK